MKALTLSLSLLAATASTFLHPSTALAADAAATTNTVKHVDAKAAAKLLETNKDIVVLDIRTPAEFTDGHIDKAVNINFLDKSFSEGIDKLDKSKTYLLHCASGGRSTKSLTQFQAKGFKNIYHLDGGFSAWESAGQPVKK